MDLNVSVNIGQQPWEENSVISLASKLKLCISSSIKREIRHFHVVVVQKRERNEQKSVLHVRSCCFPN